MDPFIGEIRIFAGNYAPRDWAFCNGQLLPIAQNTALYSIIGTTYGGDGRTTFALPDLQGRSPIHFGQGPGLTVRELGSSGGSETITLTTAQMPNHKHVAQAVVGNADTVDPAGAVWANSSGRGAPNIYNSAPSGQEMHPQAIQQTGGGAPHNNRQPYLGLNFIIALRGVFPSRS